MTRLNTKGWDEVFGKYLQASKRDLSMALNAKAFFIARRAVVETPKVQFPSLPWRTGAIIGRIINKRRGEKGMKGLWGSEMEKEVHIVYAARRRSAAFLKSGWLPAIRRLEASVDSKYRRGAARKDRAAKQFGKAKGRAVPARTGWRCIARIENAALATRDKKEALQLFGGPALQRAFDYEVQSMKDYMARKMRDTAKAHGIRTR